MEQNESRETTQIVVDFRQLCGVLTSTAFCVTSVLVSTLAIEAAASCEGGLFQLATNYPSGSSLATCVAIGDFDRDGKPDLAVANLSPASVAVLRGNGDGSFQTPIGYSVGAGATNVVVGDFNRDGRSDLAVANNASGDISVLLGNGDGTFQHAVNYGAGQLLTSLAIGDFNKDGALDLAAASSFPGPSSRVSVLLGNGDGTFQPPAFYNTSAAAHQSLAVGDFNADGHPDIAVANAQSERVHLLLGTGTGTFAAATTFAAGSVPWSAAAGDFNADGKLDLAVANASSNTVSLLIGNGDGTFQTPIIFGGGFGTSSVAVGDFNGDGKLDLALATYHGTQVSVLVGNGDGSFQNPVNFPVGEWPAFVAVGDLNGDGHPDLVIANYLSRNVSVLLGRCGTFPTHPPGSDQFTLVGNMTAQRSGHLATRLADGRVLITGATNGLLCCPFGGVPATAELYNPATQMFTPAGVMSSPRGLHAAALLSNGKVLITGGTPSPSSAELYDPNIGSFTPTPNMNGGHFFHTATLLSDGRVLIVGGPGSAELYDPISGTFHLTGSLITIRQLHTATLLADGNVLIAGGRGTSGDLNTAEVYSPFTGAFLPTGNMMATRLFFAAGLLANGQVLVTGDYFGQATSELYDRLSGIFITNGVMNTPRYNHTETPLPNGKVLVAGGHTPNNPLPAGVLSDAELYDPLTKMFSSTVRLNNGRYVHTATLLSDGKILIAGGVGINGPLATAELYTGASERDDVPPTINCPQNLVTSTDPGTCTANVTYTVTASDNLPGVAVVCTPPPGSVFHKGTSFVTCAATDAAGNTNGCSFAVTVQDSEPPQIVCPTNIVLGCNVDLLVRVQFSVSSRDNCDSLPTMTSMPASGAGFPIGTTTVMNTATDGSGNRSTCTFSVTRAPLPFSGFLPPIGGADANGGTFANPIRSFKSDSTIPVKFNASCNGSPVTAGVHRLRVAKYSDSTTPGAHIDAITQDAATSGNGFRLVDGQWHFNLDTKATGMSSGIWLLMATLSDGSQHSVWIQLK